VIVLITDPRKDDAELLKIVSAACRAIPSGELAVIFRDHSRDDFGVVDVAQKLRDVTREHGHSFLVKQNHLRIAYEVGADGVHVSEPKPNGDTFRKMASPRVIVSVPAHSEADVSHALTHAINWVLVSPIFPTPEKGAPRGLDAIRNAAEIRADHELPKIIALGGIDASNARSCIEAGADGVAVIRAILHAADPFAAARSLWDVVVASKKR
jgi:thiamine-phosphate pyrophosphorylase